MDMDFPSPAELGQIFAPTGGPIYRYDGSFWTVISGIDDENADDPSGLMVTATGGSPTKTLANWMYKFYDSSAIEGDARTFFNPSYYGNTGTGTWVEFNRIRVGDFGNEGHDIGPISNPSWATQLWGGSSANVRVMSTLGGSGISAYARSSAYNGWVSGATGGAQGVNGFTLNDGLQGHPIVCSLFGAVVHNADCKGISEACELTITSRRPPMEVTPYTGLPGGGSTGTSPTVGLNITSGWPIGSAEPLHKISCAIHVGGAMGGSTAGFRKGIVFSQSLDPTTDTLGAVAMELPRNSLIRWLNSGGSSDAKLYANASGLFLTTNLNMLGGNNPSIRMNSSIDNSANLEFARIGSGNRWVWQMTGTSETGSNAGSDIALYRYDDNGVLLGASSAFSITRSTGNMGVFGSARFVTGTFTPVGGMSGMGITLGSQATLGIFFGSGVPTLSSAKGSLYLRSDGTGTNDRIYVNTNGTNGWAALIAAS